MQDLINRLKDVAASTTRLADCNSLEQASSFILEEFSRNMSAEGGSLYQIRKNGLTLSQSLDPGHARNFIPFPLKQGSVFDCVLNEGQPIVVEDIHTQGDVRPSGYEGYKNGSFMVFPIPAVKGAVEWLITLHNKSFAAFTPGDYELGKILSTHSYEVLKAAGSVDELKNSEERFKEFTQNLPAGLFRCAPAPDEKFLMVNRAMVQIFGFGSIDEFLKSSVSDFFSRFPGDQKAVKKLYGSGIVISEQMPYKKRDGHMLWISLTAKASYDSKGEIKYIDGMVENLTLRKQRDELRVQTEKMRSIGELAVGVAHEFNNPIAGMLQNVQLITNRIRPDLKINQDAAKACGIPLKSVAAYMERSGILAMIDSVRVLGMRTAKIVANLLNFSDMNGWNSKPCDLVRIVDNTIDLLVNDFDLTRKFRFRSVDIRRQYEEDLPHVVCESFKIRQVMINLLKNSAQAMFIDPKHPSKLEVSVWKEKRLIKIEVKDNGAGMEDQICGKAFEPFFTAKPTGSGMGLGLSMAYYIITEEHGGTINIKSEKGEGTCVTIGLPFQESEKVEA